jgi:hypothetical protein
MLMSQRYCIIFAMLTLSLLMIVSSSHALRCGSSLVSRGDRKIEVTLKCGEPFLIEKWDEEIAMYEDAKFIEDETGARTSVVRRRIGSYDEEWTYNFGSNKFLQFLQFRDNKLVRIVDGPKGFDGSIPSSPDRTQCPGTLSPGDKKAVVLMKCGAPVRKDLTTDVYSRVINEEWTYNFGPQNFLYFINFRYGEITNIERGEEGY